ADGPGADYFVKREVDTLFSRDPRIDTLILGCTHYPLLLKKIRKYVPEGVTILSQGEIVAESLLDYLRRHPDMDSRISRGGSTEYLTTEQPDKFSSLAAVFMGSPVSATNVPSLDCGR
ncbi:MAG: glutamate racemase, partial [Muribaculaceae bacterium]|nr:glutamate racemase [Muribaculaceae bacterium]